MHWAAAPEKSQGWRFSAAPEHLKHPDAPGGGTGREQARATWFITDGTEHLSICDKDAGTESKYF